MEKVDGKLVYHCSTQPINSFRENPDGTYFTIDKGFCKRYKGKLGRNVRAKITCHKPFLADYKTVRKIFESMYYDDDFIDKQAENFSMSLEPQRSQILDHARREGHDCVIIPDDWDGGFGTMKSYVVLDHKKIKKVQ